MKTVLITGASSYVGARIYFDLKGKYNLIGTYFHHPLSTKFLYVNLADREEVSEIFKEVKPDVIIHVANYPSPKSAVNNEKNFIALNKKATEYVVECANDIGVKVVFISSQAASNPSDLYGQLKAASEDQVKSVRAGYLILRPSLIVGFSPNTINDRPFNRILRCLDDRTKVAEFDSSWKLQPTYLGHLSQVIDKAILGNIWNKAIPVFINEIVTQFQIAHDILDPFGVKVTPIDLHFHIPLSKDDITDFEAFNLLPHSYHEMIEMIIGEIKNRKTFKLSE